MALGTSTRWNRSRAVSAGRRLNPDHPYQNPRVTVHINDGRAFLEQTHTKYDMILFALPDSLTLVAGQSSLRLESYLFTLQAVEAAKAHLNPGDGLFAMYNYYRTPWLRDRLANTLQVAFGHTPCVDDEGFSLSMISATVNPSTMHCTTTWQRQANVVPPATDDHPFVYLDGNSIPWLYRITLALILLASIVLVRWPPARTAGWLASSTCSLWARPSCCSRRRTSCSSRCCSAPPGLSTRW